MNPVSHLWSVTVSSGKHASRDYSVCLNLTQFRGVEGCKLWVPMEVVMVEVVMDEASRDAHRETTTEVSV